MGIFNKKKKEENAPDAVQTNSFTDIMNGLQFAVNSAQEILQNHQLQGLTRLFSATNDADGKRFLSQQIKIGDKVVEVPLIALISHHYLAMDDVEIKFKAKVGSVESQDMRRNSLADNMLMSSSNRANLQMQMSGIKADADDVMEVSVRFKVQETPESISRIIDECVKNM